MSQIYRCWGVNIRQTWQMLHLPWFTPPWVTVFRYANVALTIFAIYLLLTIYMFATYLQGANLCKSIFSSSVHLPASTTEDSLTVQIYIHDYVMWTQTQNFSDLALVGSKTSTSTSTLFHKTIGYNRLARKIAIANLGGPVKRKINWKEKEGKLQF